MMRPSLPGLHSLESYGLQAVLKDERESGWGATP